MQFFGKAERAFDFWRHGAGSRTKRQWRTYTRKLLWARNEICQEMRFSARAVMYAVRINGGLVENEFSVAANNKGKKRER